MRNQETRIKDLSVGGHDLTLRLKNGEKLRTRGEVVEKEEEKNFLVSSGKRRKKSFSGGTIVVKKYGRP